MLAVAVIVTLILLLFVIPQFEALFKGFGADLPAFTRMVIDLSKFVQTQGWWMGLLFAGGVVFFLHMKKRSRGAAAIPRPRCRSRSRSSGRS